MAPRSGTVQAKDPTKIMGVKKPIFWGILALGAILAIYLWMRSRNQNTSALQNANAGTQPDTNGVTAADIGGVPSDNSFETQTDAQSIEEQIQQLQDALFQLQSTNGGNGAGISPPPTTPPGGNPGTNGGTVPPPRITWPITGPQPISNPPKFTEPILPLSSFTATPAQIQAVESLYAGLKGSGASTAQLSGSLQEISNPFGTQSGGGQPVKPSGGGGLRMYAE